VIPQLISPPKTSSYLPNLTYERSIYFSFFPLSP
jgi:hypothetical protein